MLFKSDDLRVNLHEPAVRRANDAERWRENWKQLAAERLPELADELRRRAFTQVDFAAIHERIEARIAGKRGEVFLYVSLSVNLDRPYVAQIAINDEIEYKILVRGRELSFDAALLLVDDFLAGLTAGRRI